MVLPEGRNSLSDQALRIGPPGLVMVTQNLGRWDGLATSGNQASRPLGRFFFGVSKPGGGRSLTCSDSRRFVTSIRS